MPTLRENVAVNGNAGAFTSISASQVCRHCDISEDPVNAPAGVLQGLQYQLGSEQFAVTHSLAAGETLTIGNPTAEGNAMGPVVGVNQQGTAGAFNFIAATVYAKVRSATVTATKLRIQEID